MGVFTGENHYLYEFKADSLFIVSSFFSNSYLLSKGGNSTGLCNSFPVISSFISFLSIFGVKLDAYISKSSILAAYPVYTIL